MATHDAEHEGVESRERTSLETTLTLDSNSRIWYSSPRRQY